MSLACESDSLTHLRRSENRPFLRRMVSFQASVTSIIKRASRSGRESATQDQTSCATARALSVKIVTGKVTSACKRPKSVCAHFSSETILPHNG